MAPKVFITGATGYIGGDALYAMATAHPDWELTILVRGSEKGAKVAQHYPRARLVYGTLDDADLIERESRAAGIVGNFAHADHVVAARAIIKGLAEREDGKPGFLVHTSGTGTVMLEDMKKNAFGVAFSEKVYDDLENIGEITSLPDAAPHREVDKMVLGTEEATGGKVKAAVVCPPAIYGLGRGPDSQRSHQLPELCRCTLEKGYSFKVNNGKTYWGNVHVWDLSDLYVRLLEEAVAGGSTAEWSGKPDVWGANGYFFSENGEDAWGEVSQWVADEAVRQGWIKSNEVRSITADEAKTYARAGHVLWGANSRAHAHRARAVFKWNPTRPSLKDEVRSALEYEAQKLGLKPGHAATAAGTA